MFSVVNFKSTIRRHTLLKKNIRILTGLFLLLVNILNVWAYNGIQKIPFDDALIYFELNNTDGDLGIHALIDGDAWKYLRIEDPSGCNLLYVIAQSRLWKQGLTELFFESAEPTFDELDPKKFFKRFPEGTYTVKGITLEMERLKSCVILSHLLPAPPDYISVNDVSIDPDQVDCSEGPLPTVPLNENGSVAISWSPVIISHPELGRVGESITVVNYELVVEALQLENTFSVTLPPEVVEVNIPPEFIALGDTFKFEILVREKSGNQTAVESCFKVY